MMTMTKITLPQELIVKRLPLPTYDLSSVEFMPYVTLIHSPPASQRTLSQLTREAPLFQVSPPSKVTLPDDIRRVANIPTGDNVYFRWVYPFVTDSTTDPRVIQALDASDSIVALFLFGGYLYTDGQNQQLQVNGIKRGHGLYFAGPYYLSEGCCQYLERQGRFQNITLKLQNCEAFAWLIPGEERQATVWKLASRIVQSTPKEICQSVL